MQLDLERIRSDFNHYLKGNISVQDVLADIPNEDWNNGVQGYNALSGKNWHALLTKYCADLEKTYPEYSRMIDLALLQIEKRRLEFNINGELPYRFDRAQIDEAFKYYLHKKIAAKSILSPNESQIT